MLLTWIVLMILGWGGRLAAFLRHDAADPGEIQATVSTDEVEGGTRDRDDAPRRCGSIGLIAGRAPDVA